jgi:hypothetical protein
VLCAWAVGLALLAPDVSLAGKDPRIQSETGPTLGGANRGADGRYHWKSYHTGRELLADINLWRHRFGLGSWSYDEMTVQLAEHASAEAGGSGRSGEDLLGPLVVQFLKCLARKRPFTVPVELAEWGKEDIPLTTDVSHGERLPLPAHSLLEVHILTLPREAASSRGKVINWNSILVDTTPVPERK